MYSCNLSLFLDIRPLLLLFSLLKMFLLLPWLGYSSFRSHCLLWKTFPETQVWVRYPLLCTLITPLAYYCHPLDMPKCSSLLNLFVSQLSCQFLKGNVSYWRLCLQHLSRCLVRAHKSFVELLFGCRTSWTYEFSAERLCMIPDSSSIAQWT